MKRNTGAFSAVQLTASGRNLLMQARGGHTLTFTRAVIGSGTVSDYEIDNLRQVKNEELSLDIAKQEAPRADQIRLKFTINNQQVNRSFFFREIGIMARLDSQAEVLYAYAYARENAPKIYDKTTPISERVISVDMAVANSDNIRIMLNNQAYATVGDLNAAEERLNNNNKALTTHREKRELDHPSLSVKSRHIDTLAVTESKINYNAVTELKIKDQAVSESKIKDQAVSESKIRDRAVTGAKIQTQTITGENIANSTITGDKLDKQYVYNINGKTGRIQGYDLLENTQPLYDGTLCSTMAAKGFHIRRLANLSDNPQYAPYSQSSIISMPTPNESAAEIALSADGDNSGLYMRFGSASERIGSLKWLKVATTEDLENATKVEVNFYD